MCETLFVSQFFIDCTFFYCKSKKFWSIGHAFEVTNSS